MKKTTLTLLAPALLLAGTAHAAETAVLIDSGAGVAPVVVSTPATVPVVPSPVLATTTDGTPVVVTPTPAAPTVITTTPATSSTAAVIVDEGTPRVESSTVQTSPGTTVRSTTVAQPVTTTTVTPDGTTVQSTAVKRTTTTRVTQRKTVTLSRSPYVYNSVYKNYARYRWNGKRWVYR